MKKNDEKLNFDSLLCMACGKTATRRVTILWEGAGIEIHPCLCAGCADKPAETILNEVLKHDKI